MSKKIIISTDIGTDIDDALAVCVAEKSPEIDVQGVYVTNGDLELRSRIAKKLLNSLDSSTIVGIGESEPLKDEAYEFLPPYQSGFEQICLSKSDRKKSLKSWEIEKNGLDLMRQQLNEGNISIASLAPLTNIARILQQDPILEERIDRLCIMGGRIDELEHNFRYDVKAAQEVLSSNTPITIVPANVCERYRVESDFLTRLGGSQAKRYLAYMTEIWKLRHELVEIGLTADSALRDLEGKEQVYVPGNISEAIRTFSDKRSFLTDTKRMLLSYKIFKAAIKFDNSRAGRLVRDIIEEGQVKDFGVSDVYVIYALAYPDKIETRRGNIQLDEDGRMTILPGDKHEIVTDLDYKDFESFLKGHLLEI